MPGTRFWDDVIHQPGELRRILANVCGSDGLPALASATDLMARAAHRYVTGIGSSWHAGMAIEALLGDCGRPVHLVDASELLHFAQLPQDAAILLLSRSGRSAEVVGLLEKARAAGSRVVGVTNTPDSPLARQADVVLHMGARFDHNVSATMYTGLALAGGLLAANLLGQLNHKLQGGLIEALNATDAATERWRAAIDSSGWLDASTPPILLARGASLASCHEARLLWEEAAKTPAVALTTGGFRHGPQEALRSGSRVGLWLDAERLRSQDLALAADLRRHDARVAVIGQRLPADVPGLALEVPETPRGWQFLVDIMPAQVAAELHSHLTGGNCDEFRLCPYIVADEGGL